MGWAGLSGPHVNWPKMAWKLPAAPLRTGWSSGRFHVSEKTRPTYNEELNCATHADSARPTDLPTDEDVHSKKVISLRSSLFFERRARVMYSVCHQSPDLTWPDLTKNTTTWVLHSIVKSDEITVLPLWYRALTRKIRRKIRRLQSAKLPAKSAKSTSSRRSKFPSYQLSVIDVGAGEAPDPMDVPIIISGTLLPEEIAVEVRTDRRAQKYQIN